ncbi:ubiquitin carboxyl-terminal hydrolase 30 isoform X1 [Anabrus simplex]|uniref:ubiquitin carboxyl-terminal hydrolase 30 isoform X1 n=1 Tax=Anabrus simplex TaxID=316456 RepID=UPI0035A2D6B4
MDSQIVFFCGTVVALAIGAFILWGPSSHRRRKPGYIVGLVNVGNSCFINTLLQTLASCSHLIDWLSSQKRIPGSLADAVCTTIMVLNGQQPIEGEYYTPSIVLKALKLHGWVISAGEQDAHELFHIIISALKDEVQATSFMGVSISDALGESSNDRLFHLRGHAVGFNPADVDAPEPPKTLGNPETAVCRKIQEHFKSVLPFQGLLTSQLKCLSCNHKSPLLYDKFDSLSLSLPSLGGFLFKRLTLAHLLDNYVSTETVKGVECEGCSQDQKCSRAIKSTAVKTLAFGKLPKCLCFHIQRTTWQPNGEAVKRYDHVEFPEFLSMDPYTFSQVYKRKTLCELGHSAQEGTKDGINERLSSSHARIRHLYRLVAVIVHTGGVQSGHFITYRRAPFREHCWYYASDHDVRESSLQEAMQACAYMLFYTKLSNNKSSSGPAVHS